MNKVYSKVWNKALGQLVVASELTRTNGPAGSGKGRSGAWPFALFSIVAVGSGLFGVSPVSANTVSISGLCNSGIQTGPDGVTSYPATANAADGTGTFSLVGGCSSSAAGMTGATVLGAFAKATGDGAVVTGMGSQAAKWASAFGLQANASGQSSVAMGFNSIVAAAGTSGIAIGRGATVNGAFGIAQGDGVISGATGQNVAIGSTGTTANSSTAAGAAVAIGRGQRATGDGAVAIGDPNVVNGTGAVAMGANNTAAGDATGAVAANGAVAIGNGNTAIGQGAVALGNASAASAAGAIALGDGATAGNARDVALGSGAVTAAPHTGATAVYGGAAAGIAKVASGVVSVGAAGAERQVQNVAAGVVSATSTDAINGSQLNTVVTGVNALGTSAASSLGGGATYSTTTGNIAGFSQPLNNVSAAGAVGAATAQTTVAGALAALNTSIGNSANIAVKYDGVGSNRITLGAMGGAGAPAGGVTITNLAAGVNPTDAVNFGQLTSTVAAAKTQYFSVNSTGTGNKGNNGATASDAIAIGLNAQAAAQSGVAIGVGATVTNAQPFAGGVAIGRNATAVATAASVGEGSQATMKDSAAFGAAAVSTAQGAASFGGGARAGALNSVALGHVAIVATAAESGIALGNGASVNGAFGIAQGDGVISGATGQNVAIGSTGTTANSSTAAGAAVAIGRGQRATGDGAVAIGDPNVVNGTGAVAMGANNTAAGDATGAVAANGAVAIGNGNTAIGQGAVALGNASAASAAGAIAIGDGATAANARDVALGSGSLTAAPHTGVTSVYGGTAAGIANATNGVVSVGAAGAERQIQNVAAGVVSATSTDAINGSQLNTVVTGVNALGTSTASSLGGGATYSTATGNITGFSQPLNNVSVAGAVGAATAQTTVAGALAALNTSVGNAANIAVKYDNVGSNRITLGATGGTGAPAGGVTITNLAAGGLSATSTDAVNGSQLNTTNQQVSGINTRLTTAEGTIAGHTTQITALQTDALQWNPSLGAYDASHGTGTAQKISNVAAGDVSATSTDAVNGSQLNATNQQVAGIDTRVTTAEGTIAGHTTQITALQTDALQWNPTLGAYDASHGTGTAQKISNVAAGTAGTDAVNVTQLDAVSTAVGDANDRAVVYDGAVGSAKDTITLAGTTGTKVTNVAAGDVSATSTDAVNGSQLNTTNQQVAGIDTRVTTAEGTIAGHTTQITALQTDALQWNPTLGAYDASHGTGTAQKISNVAAGTAGTDAVNLTQLNAVSTAVGDANDRAVVYDGAVGSAKDTITLAGAAGTKITNVAAGDVSATSTDAVNGSQLNTTNQQVAAIDTRVTTAEGTIAGHTTQITALQTDALQWNPTLGAYDASHGTGTAQKISNVAAGTVATDAVNLAQLDAVSTAVGNANDRAVTYDGSVGSAKDTITLAGAAGTKISNVTAGAVSATSTDAVNGSQLFAANQAIGTVGSTVTNLGNSVASGLGGGSTYDPTTGTVSTNLSYGGNTYGSVQDVFNQISGVVDGGGIKYFHASSNLADSVASGLNSVAIGPVSTASAENAVSVGNAATASVQGGIALGSGAISDRAVAPTSGTITVGTNLIPFNTTDRTLQGAVSVGNTTDFRQITNVADGTEDQDAVTLRQLKGAMGSFSVTPIQYFHTNSTATDSSAIGAESVAIGPQTTVNGDNGIGLGNHAIVAQTAPGGTAIGQNATVNLADGVALGTNATSNGIQAVALGTGSQAAFAGSVALGAGSTTDAAVATAGTTLNGTAYTFAGAAPGSTVSVGSAGAERTITNLAAGRISATSTDAINGSQLYATNQTVALLGSQIINLSNTVNNFPTGGGGKANDTYNNSGDNSSVSSATGKNATAVGAGSTASGDNSVAIGAGSVADSANTVSVGSVGHERTVTNVASGVNPTDAANVGQLNQAIEQAKNWSKDYVDQRFQSVNRDLDRASSRANAGIASAMAMSGLGQAYQADQSTTGIALGTFHGETGLAIGMSTITESGRYILKLNGTTNSRGDTGASIGATMVW